MRLRGQIGISHIQILVIMVMVSVIATAFWNLQVNNMDTDFDNYSRAIDGNDVKIALEDIKYHLGLAGYALEDGQKPLEIEKNEKSEVLKIRHNDVCFEFYVDHEFNLIKKVETSKKVMATNISSLKTAGIGGRKLIVTLATVPLRENDENNSETLSKSYTTIVDMKSLM